MYKLMDKRYKECLEKMIDLYPSFKHKAPKIPSKSFIKSWIKENLGRKEEQEKEILIPKESKKRARTKKSNLDEKEKKKK